MSACKRHLLIGVDHVAMRPRYNAQRNWNCCDHFQTITRKIQEPLFSILALAIRCNQNTFNSLIKKNRLNGKPLNEYHLFVITVTKPWQFPIFKSSNLVLNFLNEVNIRFHFFFPFALLIKKMANVCAQHLKDEYSLQSKVMKQNLANWKQNWKETNDAEQGHYCFLTTRTIVMTFNSENISSDRWWNHQYVLNILLQN